MIKLLENTDEIKKIAACSPYLGGHILKDAFVFEGCPDLMNIWTEQDNHGKTVSAVMLSGSITVIGTKSGPGPEMLVFLKSITSDVTAREIICDEMSLKKIQSVFPGKITERTVMKCSRHIPATECGFSVLSDNDSNDIISVLESADAIEHAGDREMFDFRTVRGRLRGQVKTFTAYDNGVPVGTAIINGITSSYGNIDSVATVPSYRKKGIATCLVSGAAAFLKGMRVDSLLVPDNDSLVPFYEKIGFRKNVKIYYLSLNEEKL